MNLKSYFIRILNPDGTVTLNPAQQEALAKDDICGSLLGDEIRNLVRAKVSIIDIAKTAGVSRYAIYLFLKKPKKRRVK